MENRKTAVLIGAGPAGLTAALELLRRTDIVPVILEKSDYVGGISRTVNYKGNRIDIGGHRFFSKSDRVMQWWLDIMPVEATGDSAHEFCYQGQRRTFKPEPRTVPAGGDRLMLVRARKSRIYFLRKFFEYPLKLNLDTLRNLGAIRALRIGLSYAVSTVKRIRPELSLQDFLINRFGKELYRTFFKSYTEKVWGVPCDRISAEWGAQRIKGLSLTKAVLHHLSKLFRSSRSNLGQKETETSLIEKFLYPKFGPGQLWEYVAEEVAARGGQILKGWTVDSLQVEDSLVTAVIARDEAGVRRRFEADYVFSTMPVKELVRALDCEAPANVREVSEGLLYRDFITVGLLLDRMRITEDRPGGAKLLSDNWIYIQEPDVLVGRLQIFNNWSPYMVADPSKIWVGLEYFCNDTDDLWKLPDDQMIRLAASEMVKLGMIDEAAVADATVIRMEKTYPAYFGTYGRFDEVRDYLSTFGNLFLIGRNGMHKYNNQDHSMLTAMIAVDNIQAGIVDKSNLWAVNTEMEYHEEKAEPQAPERIAPAVPPVEVPAPAASLGALAAALDQAGRGPSPQPAPEPAAARENIL